MKDLHIYITDMTPNIYGKYKSFQLHIKNILVYQGLIEWKKEPRL